MLLWIHKIVKQIASENMLFFGNHDIEHVAVVEVQPIISAAYTDVVS